MRRVRVHYLVYVLALFASVAMWMFPRMPYAAMMAIVILIVAGLGGVALSVELQLGKSTEKREREHLERQMSILITLVIGGITSSLQLVAQPSLYGVNLADFLSLVTWAIYGLCVYWIVAGGIRSLRG